VILLVDARGGGRPPVGSWTGSGAGGFDQLCGRPRRRRGQPGRQHRPGGAGSLRPWVGCRSARRPRRNAIATTA